MRISRSLSGAAFGVAWLAASAESQETTRVSVDSSGTQGDGFATFDSAISADGWVVAFASDSTNLVPGDTNGRADVFVHDRSTGITERVSLDPRVGEADGDSRYVSISADGNFVAFGSYATNLVPGDTNGTGDVFVYDRRNASIERVSVSQRGGDANSNSNERQPSISADGQFVAFVSYASDLVAGDTNGKPDVFVRDRLNGVTERVSVDSSGAEGNEISYHASISDDGQVVAFLSLASNLVPGDTNGTSDVFVHDRSTGITERVSTDSSGAEANSYSEYPSISAGGGSVAFHCNASNLVAGDTNNLEDVFVHERATGVTERVSVDAAGAQGNGQSDFPSISADGRIVAFLSYATNLVTGDTNANGDVFVHDRSTGRTERISLSSSGTEANAYCTMPSITADGEIVAFSSLASNLVAGDTNGDWDIFVHERCAVDADWTNYGAGFAGTNGVPSFAASADPVLGTSILLDVANSCGKPTIALLFVGFQRGSFHSGLGGDLLLQPAFTSLVSVPTDGAAFSFAIPYDAQLCGFAIDLQAWESDPGAAKGVSFTPGLELLLGH